MGQLQENSVSIKGNTTTNNETEETTELRVIDNFPKLMTDITKPQIREAHAPIKINIQSTVKHNISKWQIIKVKEKT